MGTVIWRAWAALCLLAGAVVVPLFWEVFSGGSMLRFVALPLRFAWAWWLCRPVLAEGWLPPRVVAAGLVAFCGTVSAAILTDLLGQVSLHPGWFLTLEWWQRGLYPWLDLLPPWSWRLRPGYLWVLSAWNLAEALFWAGLLWRWRPAGPTERRRPRSTEPPAPGTGHAGAGEHAHEPEDGQREDGSANGRI